MYLLYIFLALISSLFLVLPLYLSVFLLLLFLLTSLVWSHLLSRSPPSFFSTSSRLLLIIAHPDDETMFFSPLIRNAIRSGVRVFVLCLSSGDYYGEGDIRRRELFDAVVPLGVDPSDVTVMDMDECRDGHEWSPSLLLPLIRRFILSLDVQLVCTFDDMGVSGHCNHTACSLTLKTARSIIPMRIEFLRLESPSLFRKYSSFLSLFISFIRDSPQSTVISSPSDIISTWRAMTAHRSQLLWFRYLYMLTSSLLYTNSFTRVPTRVRSPY